MIRDGDKICRESNSASTGVALLPEANPRTCFESRTIDSSIVCKCLNDEERGSEMSKPAFGISSTSFKVYCPVSDAGLEGSMLSRGAIERSYREELSRGAAIERSCYREELLSRGAAIERSYREELPGSEP
jgi:hypothetical protein